MGLNVIITCCALAFLTRLQPPALLSIWQVRVNADKNVCAEKEPEKINSAGRFVSLQKKDVYKKSPGKLFHFHFPSLRSQTEPSRRAKVGIERDS